jgi:integrase
MSAARGSVIKRGSTYTVVLDVGRDENGKRLRRWHSGFRTKNEAEQARTRLMSALDAGTYTEPTKLTFGAFVKDKWLPALAATVRPNTLAMYRINLDKHIVPALGHIRLTKLSPEQLNAFYAQLLSGGRRDGKGGLSTRTVRINHMVLHRALTDAVKWGYLTRNIAALADPPKVVTAEIRPWTPEQLSSFLQFVATDRLAALWRLVASTGMRRGEILGLRWSDVDLGAGCLTIGQTLVVVNYKLAFSEPKTVAGKRTLALDPQTVTALRSHWARQAEERLVWGGEWQDTGLVFTREDGSPIHPERLSKWFDQRVNAAKLPRITFHGLRHSYVTMLLRAGQPLRVVSQRAGHSSPNVTTAVYAHVMPGDDEAAAAVGARLLGGVG